MYKIRFFSNFIDTFVLKKFKNISIEIQLLAPMLSVYRTQKKNHDTFFTLPTLIFIFEYKNINYPKS